MHNIIYFRMVRDFKAANNTNQIRKILRVLGSDFATSQNPHTRKGGLLGLGAVAVALGPVRSLFIFILGWCYL